MKTQEKSQLAKQGSWARRYLFSRNHKVIGLQYFFLSLLAADGSVWPVFNLADSAIVCGGAVLILLAATGRDFDGTRGPRRPGSPGPGDTEFGASE